MAAGVTDIDRLPLTETPSGKENAVLGPVVEPSQAPVGDSLTIRLLRVSAT